jgi:hypothetical protein
MDLVKVKIPTKHLLISILPMIIVAACNQAGKDLEPAPIIQGANAYRGIRLDAPENYRASFLLQFEGADPWSYYLTIRSDGDRLEHSLHIDGVGAARNPGDVRMVTQGNQNRIQGPGTEGECLIFPSKIDLGPAFLLPDDLIPPEAIGPSLQDLGDDTVAGMDARRYGLRSDQLGGWKDVLVDIWLSNPDNAVMRYDLHLVGEDSYFGRGQGSLLGRFVVESVGLQIIEPIPGCEIEFPIPESAENLVRLPGLIEFDSPSTIEDLTSYYQDMLVDIGWNAAGDPEQSGDIMIMSYLQGDRGLEIVLERLQDGVHVRLLPG